MKTKIWYTAILLTGLFIASCGNSNRNIQNNDRTPMAVDSIHNSRNSLDYAGTYVGTMPCADCSGIRTEITLNADGTYSMVSVYEGKGNEGENTFRDSGRYTWNNAGSVITLNNDSTEQYQVGENQLIALDMHGEKITGELADMYILKKR